MVKIKVPSRGGTIKETCLTRGPTETVVWESAGAGSLIDLFFVNAKGKTIKTPDCFRNRRPRIGGGDTISFEYDGSAIPAAGHLFVAWVDGLKVRGNGTGVIRNH